MENSFQTSFIPKKPINATYVTKTPMNGLLVLAVIVFVIVIVAGVGLYFYKNYLIDQKNVLSESLNKISSTFEPETIKELEMFGNRTSTAKQVLQNHIVLSPMFEMLGALTIPQIQYTDFEHEMANGEFYVKISGLARDYKTIASQADVFSSEKGKYFRNLVFSNLEKDKSNYLNFDLEFIVDPVVLSYENNLSLKQQSSTFVPPVDSTNNLTN